jgi:DNA-binding transcriptional LysR family regulator
MLTDQLRYFLVAARVEHIGRAAEQLELSQPALSRSIQKLEEEVGLPLFLRAGRGVRLNAAGKILLRRVERAGAEFDDARRELQELRNTKVISVGYLATFAVRLIPDLVKSFSTREPNVHFKLFEGPSPVLARQLLEGELDLCLSTDLAEPALEWQPLFREELVASIPEGHPLAIRKSIELKELADEPFVALRSGHGLRAVLEELCRKAGFAPKVKLEGYEVASLRGLVGAGFGVTLAPKRIGPPSKYVDIPVTWPKCFRTVGISWRKERWLPAKPLAFKEFLVKELRAIQSEPARGSEARRTPQTGRA